MTETPGGEIAAERMQRLLSRAVEEQVSEQRQAVSLLSEVRASLATLEAGVRGAASQETVDRLDSSVSTVVADVRTSTALVSQRLEALAARVDSLAAEATAPAEQTTVRLSALAAEVSAQGAAVDRVQEALVAFEAFPAALAALQRDIAGLHQRLAPLGDLQSAVGDVAARTVGALNELRPQLDALAHASQGGPGPEQVRDAVVDALGARLTRLEEAAARPVVSPELLSIGLGDLRANVRAGVGEQLEPVTERIGELQQRVDLLADRVAEGPAAPDLSGDVARLADRVESLSALPSQVDAALAGISALRSDTSVQGVRAALETFADGAAHLSEQVARIQLPSVDDLSTVVSARVADRLVEVLAPRIADVVLTRVSAALVTQLGEAIAPRLRDENDAATRAVVAESEKRVLAHVDEAVLALAEALIRRKGLTRPAVTREAAGPGVPGAGPDPSDGAGDTSEEGEPVAWQPVHEIVAELGEPGPVSTGGSAAEAPEQASQDEPVAVGVPAEAAPATQELQPAAPVRPAVTTGLAPAPQAAVPAPVEEVPAQRSGTTTPGSERGAAAGPAQPTSARAGTPAVRKAAAKVPSRAPDKQPPAKPASGTAAKDPAKTAPAKAAVRPAAGKAAPASVAAKAAPAKAASPKAAPAKAAPVKPAGSRQQGSLRPARPTRNVPILDRTPDLAPPSGPPLGGRPAPPAVPRQGPTAPAAAPQRPAAVPPPPAPAPPSAPEAPSAPEKKRRWWRSTD